MYSRDLQGEELLVSNQRGFWMQTVRADLLGQAFFRALDVDAEQKSDAGNQHGEPYCCRCVAADSDDVKSNDVAL